MQRSEKLQKTQEVHLRPQLTYISNSNSSVYEIRFVFAILLFTDIFFVAYFSLKIQ